MMKRRAIRSTVLVCLLLAGAFWIPRVFQTSGQYGRRVWKNQALPKIREMAEDKAWVTREIKTLQTDGSPQILEAGWLTEHLILMTNGEWLVYESHCSKAKPRSVKDIFLAKGSNGKWYYSTFHFCVGMVSLRMEQETVPPDLPTFATEYNLREFDGRSDECLKPTGTWPASRKANSNDTSNRSP